LGESKFQVIISFREHRSIEIEKIGTLTNPVTEER
jgi:hypothetical protein